MSMDLPARGMAQEALDRADYANERINQMPNGYIAKGTVDYYTDLPASGNQVGDSYTVQHADETHKAGRYAWGYSHGALKWYYSDGDNDYATQTELEDAVDELTVAIGNAQTAAENAQSTADSKSAVAVAGIGTSVNRVGYITVDGVEYKIDKGVEEIDLTNSGNFDSLYTKGAYLVKFNNTTINRPFNTSVAFTVFMTVSGEDSNVIQMVYRMFPDETQRQTIHIRKYADNAWGAWKGSHAITADEKTAWDGKQDAIDSEHKLAASLVDDSDSTNKFVTNEEKNTWNGKSTVSAANAGTSTNTVGYITIDGVEYKLPDGGIPTVDLRNGGDFNTLNTVGGYLVTFDNSTTHRPYKPNGDCTLFVTVTGVPNTTNFAQTTYRVFPDATQRQTIYTRVYVVGSGWNDTWLASHAITGAEKTAWDGKQDAITANNKISADFVNDSGTVNKFVPCINLLNVSTYPQGFNESVLMHPGLYTVNFTYNTLYRPVAFPGDGITLNVYQVDNQIVQQMIFEDYTGIIKIWYRKYSYVSQQWEEWRSISVPPISATDVIIE